MQLFAEGTKVIELGGGARPVFRPNCDVRPCHNEHGIQTVDFVADFNEILPITSEEWEGVFSHYVLEHVSWRKVRQFISEIFRILKPGGKTVVITADTEAQFKWLSKNPTGWDGKNFFDSASCIIYGDNDYPENSHRNYLSQDIAIYLFREAGFVDVIIQPWGARSTDMLISAVKPSEFKTNVLGTHVNQIRDIEEQRPIVLTPEPLVVKSPYPRELLFDKHYFHGGAKVGGYAGDGYRDFPVHEVTFRRILDKKPESVMEIGCARGYILKRLQDVGIRANGLEISNHCWLTRVCNGIINKDICEGPFPWKDKEFDLAFSIAAFEHIPEEHLLHVFKELERTCKRGLHGIDFGGNDDGFDKTHCTLRSKEWWQQRMPAGHEVVDKESLEQMDEFPRQILKGDGKVKLNIGCFTVMFHHGWINIDNHSNIQYLQNFAAGYGHQFLHHDINNGLPQFKTGQVDMIYSSHMLEHLSYEEGLKFLRECRRVLNHETGVMRLIVPDAKMLTGGYANLARESGAKSGFDFFNEINDGCENAPTQLMKLWAMLLEGHKSMYDWETISYMLDQAGFVPLAADFRQTPSCKQSPYFDQMRKETIDMFPSHSLYASAVCKTQ